MKCHVCGESIKNDSKFCSSCGSEIQQEDYKVRFSRRPEKYDGPKRLYRSRKDRWVAGVCGGMGEYFDIDPILIRALWAIAIFAGGTGLLAYLVCIVLIPESPYEPWSE